MLKLNIMVIKRQEKNTDYGNNKEKKNSIKNKNHLTQKEFQELQRVWEETKERLKKSANEEDQMIAKFLECNCIHPETGLITNKSEWSSAYTSCGSKELKK